MIVWPVICVLAYAVILSGCKRTVGTDDSSDKPPATSYPLSKKVEETKPVWNFFPDKPFHLEFGRGSGMRGLELVMIDETRQATLFRMNYDRADSTWETAQLRLSKRGFSQIVDTINRLEITRMAKQYHANVHDGNQWIFWLTQGSQGKTIFFDNHFPKAIEEFARTLDETLQTEGLGKVQWSAIPKEKWRDHEKSIWQSIED